MNVADARNALLRRVRAPGVTLTALLPSEGIRIMLAWYEDVRADGCDLDRDADMLLYQWGVDEHRASGPAFFLDLTRQFTRWSGDDHELRQLSLTFHYVASAPHRALGAADRWCHTPAELPVFETFIQSSPAFQLLAGVVAHDVNIAYGLV